VYQRILVPLDGSLAAEDALPYALELCRLSGGTLTLVRVAPSVTQPPALYSLTDAETWLIRQRQMQAEAELYLAEIAARTEVAAANPQHLVISGEAGQSLLTLIHQELFML
jgi:nucleotide-binding universal stress UspA family protein